MAKMNQKLLSENWKHTPFTSAGGSISGLRRRGELSPI